MIDIHAHILPGIDDGAEDLDSALEMAAMLCDIKPDDEVIMPSLNIILATDSRHFHAKKKG